MSNVIKRRIQRFEQNGFFRNKSKDEIGKYINKYYMERNNITYIIIADKDKKKIKIKRSEKETCPFNNRYKIQTKEIMKSHEIMAQYNSIKAPKIKLEKY